MDQAKQFIANPLWILSIQISLVCLTLHFCAVILSLTGGDVSSPSYRYRSLWEWIWRVSDSTASRLCVRSRQSLGSRLLHLHTNKPVGDTSNMGNNVKFGSTCSAVVTTLLLVGVAESHLEFKPIPSMTGIKLPVPSNLTNLHSNNIIKTSFQLFLLPLCCDITLLHTFVDSKKGCCDVVPYQ